MFQPHRYTRTLALKEEFGRAFDQADAVLIADVYPASEKAIPGVSGQMIVDAMRTHGHPHVEFQPDIRRIHQNAGLEIQDGDLILSLCAGNVHEAGRAWSATWLHATSCFPQWVLARSGFTNRFRDTPPCALAARRNFGRSPKLKRALPIWSSSVSTKTSRLWSWVAVQTCSCAMGACPVWWLIFPKANSPATSYMATKLLQVSA